jgi:hypothetical protein
MFINRLFIIIVKSTILTVGVSILLALIGTTLIAIADCSSITSYPCNPIAIAVPMVLVCLTLMWMLLKKKLRD